MYSLNDLCFLCLTNSKNLKSILTQDQDGVVVEEKLRYFLFELVNIKTDIPKHICSLCLKDLNHVYDFKQRCLRNIIKLNNYLQTPCKSRQTKSELSHNTAENTNIDSAVIVKRETDENCEADKTEIEYVLLQDSHKNNLKNEDCEAQTEQQFDLANTAVEDIVVKIEPEDLPEVIGEEDDEDMDVDDAPAYKCPHCLKPFPSELNLRRHLRSHLEAKPYKCAVCPYETVRPFDLKYHMSKHTGDKPHACAVCGYRCARPKDMRSHMRCHTGERPYECEVCHKRFPHISNLRRHSQTHSPTKPHHCSYCDFKCSHADYLKVHVRQHTGAKDFQCDVCPKRFATNSHLLRHRRFHDDSLRPHPCPACDKRFKLASHLSKHVERAHSDRFKCGACAAVFARGGELARHRTACQAAAS